MNQGIVTTKLTKHYPRSRIAALDRLSICVKPGEVYGFLGANGAGKSTTIRLLMNFLQPSSGTASIAGLDSVTQSVAVKQHVGYLSGDVALYSKTTGAELLGYLAKLQGGIDHTYLKKLEKRFEAETQKKIQTLSKGNRQKIGILQAFMHQPSILILDEPTSGLDPLMQEAFYETVSEARARGAAVLMSSHNLTEAQRICDRIGVLKHGKLLREQTVADLATIAAPLYEITFKDGSDFSRNKTESSMTILSQTKNTVTVQPTKDIAAMLGALSGYDIVSLTSHSLSLEDEFIDFYGESA